MKCWIRNSRLFIIRVLWISGPYSVLHSHPIVCFVRWRIVVRHFQPEGWLKLPVKQHKTKTTNRYFNYMYVRAGAYTYINKRTENDIWKNLFELPLIETPVSLSEEEFLSLPEFKSFTGIRGESGDTFGLQKCEACIVSSDYLRQSI